MGNDEPVDSAAGEHGERFDGPVPVELLADLQAGLLDDREAAGLRHRARIDPDVAHELATLDRVRRAVAHLGVDADSAPAVPAEVAARVGAALRNQPAAADGAPGVRTAVAAVGVLALVAAVVLALVMMLLHANPRRPPGT